MSPAWVTAIEQFLNYMRAAGQTVASVDSRRSHLQHLARRIEADPFDVTGQHLVAWFGRQTWAQETRRGRRTSYQVFYDWAVREELTSTNPASKLPTVKGAKPRPRPIPRSAFDQAVRGSDARVRLMLRLAYDAGLRRCEIAVIHSSDLIEDLVGWSLLVHGKGNKERVVPLTPWVGIPRRLRRPPVAPLGRQARHDSPTGSLDLAHAAAFVRYPELRGQARRADHAAAAGSRQPGHYPAVRAAAKRQPARVGHGRRVRPLDRQPKIDAKFTIGTGASVAVETTEYLAMLGRMIRAGGRRVADSDELELERLVALRAELDQAIVVAVLGQRNSLGRSWAWVGSALGISKQAAQQRWGRL
jgi:integrase/recombinase XerC